MPILNLGIIGGQAGYLQKRHIFGDMKLEVLDSTVAVVGELPNTKRSGLSRVTWSMRLKPPTVPQAASANELGDEASSSSRCRNCCHVVDEVARVRRMAGAPVRGESYLRADVTVGRVGPDQAPPCLCRTTAARASSPSTHLLMLIPSRSAARVIARCTAGSTRRTNLPENGASGSSPWSLQKAK